MMLIYKHSSDFTSCSKETLLWWDFEDWDVNWYLDTGETLASLGQAALSLSSLIL